VTQFEADIRLAKQLSKFWIEGNGGGNRFESYNLPWYFAATRTKCDAIVKRKRKGYIFTVGDEPPPPVLRAQDVEKFLGRRIQHDIPTADVLKMATRDWEVFHIMIAEGHYFRSRPDQTSNEWRKLLQQRAMTLSDHTKLAELIVSTIEVNEGADALHVAGSWSGDTSLVLRDALCAVSKSAPVVASGKGVTRL
jgi:hypothetical protein